MDLELKRGMIATAGPRANWDYEAILANARALQQMVLAGKCQTLLEGKHVAILSGDYRSGSADMFVSAARGLGAQVAEVRTGPWIDLPRVEIKRMAAVLEHLYAAVECQGTRHSIVQLIEAAAHIPVYDHIASPDHPTARIAEKLEGSASRDEKRRLVLQAVLIGTIA